MLTWFANPIKTAAYKAWVLSIFFLLPTQSFSAQATLAWDPNDPAPEGYRIFQRIEGQIYDYNQPVWSGPGTTGTVDGLADGDKYYFVVRAYDGSAESADSNEVAFQSALPAPATHTISANAGPHGSISPGSAVTVADGEDQSFAITADAGYHIADVVVDGVSQGAVSAYTFHQVSRNHTIDASFVLNTYTIAASAGPYGSISPQGVVSIDHGGSQTFTIVPEAGYHVADVKVDGLSKGSLTSFTFNQVTANRSIEASFSKEAYTIPQTTQATLAWDPNDPAPEGYRIYQRTEGQAYNYSQPVWTGSGTTGTVYNLEYDTTYYFVVRAYDGDLESADSNEVVFAGQSPLPATYTIAVTSGSNGSVTPGSTVAVASGADQTFTIAPDTGYHVSDVRVDGVSVGAVSSYTFNQVAANHSLAASFAIDTHTLAISAGSNGSIAPNGTLSVEFGASETVTITPNAGYHVSDVVVDGLSVGALDAYTFSNVTGDHTIVASFAIDTYTISASTAGNGSITPSGLTSVMGGTDVIYTITPDAGYAVADVTVDRGSIGAASSYTFSQVGANHAIHATFTATTYTITALAGENGSVSPAGSADLPKGASQTYTFSADSGYHIDNVQVDGQSMGAIVSYTFADIDSSHTLDVTFAENSKVEIWIEAEDGDLQWPMAIAGDENAGAGGFVWVAEGTGIASTLSENSGYAEYHFEVPEAGSYVIWGRQVSNDTASDSFFVSLDDQDEMVWHTKHGGEDVWVWDVVANRDASDPDYAPNPEIFWLAAGPHTLKITQREDGTKLDRLLITNQTDLTDPDPDSVLDAMEYGEVELNHQWQRIAFKKPFVNPVVVAGPISLNGGDPAVVRIQNVDTFGFDMRIQEWDYLDGYHAVEMVSYLVMEQGTHTLEDGTKIEAGVVATGASDAFQSILFNEPFNVVPVVITAITSVNDAACVTGRLVNIGVDGFKYGLQEQESNVNDHTAEMLAYIAWEPSSGVLGTVPFVVSRTGDAVKTKLFTIGFDKPFADSPAFLADMQTSDGRDTANLRYANKGEASVDVKVHEETSKDTEMGHTSEVVGYMLFGR